jgi:hypothetical protein
LAPIPFGVSPPIPGEPDEEEISLHLWPLSTNQVVIPGCRRFGRSSAKGLIEVVSKFYREAVSRAAAVSSTRTDNLHKFSAIRKLSSDNSSASVVQVNKDQVGAKPWRDSTNRCRMTRFWDRWKQPAFITF